MRKAVGIAILGMTLGMFLMLLVRDRLVGLILIIILGMAGYVCTFDC